MPAIACACIMYVVAVYAFICCWANVGGGVFRLPPPAVPVAAYCRWIVADHILLLLTG